MRAVCGWNQPGSGEPVKVQLADPCCAAGKSLKCCCLWNLNGNLPVVRLA